MTSFPTTDSAVDYQTVFEAAASASLLLASDLTVVAASDAYLRATRTRREDLLGRRIFEVFPWPDDPAAPGPNGLGASLERVLRSRSPDTMPVRKEPGREGGPHGRAARDRYWRPVNSPLVTRDGEVAYVVHTLEDVTDLVGREAERTRLEAELAGLRTERAADLARVVRLHEIATRFVRNGDVDALLEDVLEAAMAITGTDLGNVQLYNPETGVLEIAAQHGFRTEFLDFFASVDGHLGACGAAMRTARRVVVEDVLTDPIFQDRTARRIMIEAGVRAVQSTPLRSRTGKPLGVLSTHFRVPHRPSESALRFVDLLAAQVAEFIDHKRLEAECERLLAHERAARADAELANRVKDEFLARASHELRTPLTSILGSIRLLKQVMTGRRPGSPDELLDMASRNLAVMLGLLNDLLDASKLTASETPLVLERIGLADVVLASKEIVEAQAREKRITLRSVVPAKVTLQADPLKLVQVFTNLLANAVKFTASGGEVVVEAETDRDDVLIRVRDTGIGIAREHLDRVFRPFYQARAARQGPRGPRGTGLGLSICQQIVTLHGGRIWAESDGPGQGATFIVQLPASSTAGRAA